jgi:hypothetical protein
MRDDSKRNDRGGPGGTLFLLITCLFFGALILLLLAPTAQGQELPVGEGEGQAPTEWELALAATPGRSQGLIEAEAAAFDRELERDLTRALARPRPASPPPPSSPRPSSPEESIHHAYMAGGIALGLAAVTSAFTLAAYFLREEVVAELNQPGCSIGPGFSRREVCPGRASELRSAELFRDVTAGLSLALVGVSVIAFAIGESLGSGRLELTQACRPAVGSGGVFLQCGGAF